MVEEDQRFSDAALIRNQISILNIAEGFFQSSVLFALLKLKIFELIADGARTVSDLAEQVGARAETLARLLNAGVVLKLIDTQDGVRYRLTPVSRSVLSPAAGENSLTNWIRNLDYFRLALSKLDEAVMKSGPTVDAALHLGADKESTREFILAMHNYAALRGRELARYLDTACSRTVLDLGCGPGTYAFHLGMRNPEVELFLADLPEVLEVAKEVQRRYSIRNQVHYLPLDILRDEIPGSYDIILVSNTLHMLGEDASRELIKRLYASVNTGGCLIIQAQFLQDDRLGPRWPVCLDLVQLCITSKGRNHTVAETRRWLEEASFAKVEFHPMTMLNTNSFLMACKM